MSESPAIPPEFAQWIVRSLDGTITPEDFERLDHEIQNNPQARAYYLENITVYLGLANFAGTRPGTLDLDKNQTKPTSEDRLFSSEGHYLSPTSKEFSNEDRVRQIEAYAREQLTTFLSKEHQDPQPSRSRRSDLDLRELRDRYLAKVRHTVQRGVKIVRVAAVVSVAALILLIISLHLYENRVVARLAGSTDATWDHSDSSDGTEFRKGWLKLDQGYAQIVMRQGTEIILQAPSILQLQSANRIYLESGWMTAKVPERASGFTVDTPSSSVTDFGTEFGLRIGVDNQAEVHVFDGRVALSASRYRRSRGDSRMLNQGQAALVNGAGGVNQCTLGERPPLFFRELPKHLKGGKRRWSLDLADVVGGGSGFGTGVRRSGIDPNTGRPVRGRADARWGENRYMPVPTHDMIDGVFVPSGKAPPIISSQTHRFHECPATSGAFWTDIVNGGLNGDRMSFPIQGQEIGTSEFPCILLHANLGITFDLQAVRAFTPGLQIVRFRSRIGIAPRTHKLTPDADVWILVDGQLRYHKNLHVDQNTLTPISLDLETRHRFLTLVATEGKPSASGIHRNTIEDWCLFAEPELELTLEGVEP